MPSRCFATFRLPNYHLLEYLAAPALMQSALLYMHWAGPQGSFPRGRWLHWNATVCTALQQFALQSQLTAQHKRPDNKLALQSEPNQSLLPLHIVEVREVQGCSRFKLNFSAHMNTMELVFLGGLQQMCMFHEPKGFWPLVQKR
jgi:hypothetical protein